MAKLLQREDKSLENIITFPKHKDVEIMKLSDSDTGIEAHQETSAVDMKCQGIMPCKFFICNQISIKMHL